ncbi:hypothetical protein C9J20_19995, partial [Photobacterium phosphoreum]
ISACWAFEYRNSCHIKESLDSNVGAFLRLHYCSRLGMAVTGRAADSAIPKISACWAFEYRNSCHIKESLDSNVGAFLRLHYCSRLGMAVTGRVADSPYRNSALKTTNIDAGI